MGHRFLRIVALPFGGTYMATGGESTHARCHVEEARAPERVNARMPDHIIATPHSISLADYDPADTEGLSHQEARERAKPLEQRLGQLQQLLYAADHQSVLLILQGLDTSGKDGTIKHVLAQINPVGCHVWSFKQPTPDELAHDFLWRAHVHTPARGMVAVFNRSYYEDVLVARVHELVPQSVWEQRYEQINNFERMLTQNGTVILKFFLHISNETQRKRLLKREDTKDKQWKLSVTDWQERTYWESYQRAYEDALGRCGTPWAPWILVPADKKWFRNYVIARDIVGRLDPLARDWEVELAQRGQQELKALAAAHLPDREKR